MVRKKHRYVLAEVVYENSKLLHPLSADQLYQAIRAAYLENFGEYGLALVKISLKVSFLNENTNMMLVRIRRGAERMLSSSFLTMKILNKYPMKIVTKHISGSIRCAQKYWLRYNRRTIGEMIKSCQNEETKKELLEKLDEANKCDLIDIFKRRKQS